MKSLFTGVKLPFSKNFFCLSLFLFFFFGGFLFAQEDSVYFHQGGREIKAGDYKAAAESYTKALEVNPNMTDAYYARALCFLSLNKKTEAAGDLQKLLEIDSENSDAYNMMGLIYERKGELDQALEYYNQAILVNVKNGFAYSNRADLYAEMKKSDLAESDYLQAIQLLNNINQRATYVHLGWLYYDQKEYAKAMDCANKVIDALDANYREAYELRSSVYDEQEAYDKADADRKRYKQLPRDNELCSECKDKK